LFSTLPLVGTLLWILEFAYDSIVGVAKGDMTVATTLGFNMTSSLGATAAGFNGIQRRIPLADKL
jgi:hypothetical protein